MLKALLIAEAQEDVSGLLEQITDAGNVKILARVIPGVKAIEAVSDLRPDIIITSQLVAEVLNESLVASKQQSRLSVTASTHQGIQLVSIEDIYYFQAEDKYVTAHHKDGELLIEDTMLSLEREFGTRFVRIHRKTLVAINKIESLYKNDAGQHFVTMRGKKIELAVSRRQLSKVRDALLCK